MPWANFDDQFPKHPKVLPLSDAAFRLHVSGVTVICYSKSVNSCKRSCHGMG